LKVEATKRTRLLNSLQEVPNPTAVPTFAEFADQFLEWAKANLAEATVVLHRVNIDRLKQFFRGKLINEIDRKSVEEFKVWRAAQRRENGKGKVSGATVNRNLTTLKRIFNHADAMGLNVKNPVKYVPYFKEAGRVRVLTLEEVDKYLAAAKGDLRDFAVLALETGARPTELFALKRSDINLEGKYVSLPGTKTRRAKRDVPLTDDALEVLKLRMEKNADTFVFPVRRPKTKNMDVKHITSLRKAHDAVIAKHFTEDPFTVYTFRHTYGTRHAQAGTELPVLAELMGHSSIQTTMVYVHCSRKMKIEATARLQAYVEAARRAKQLQEAESWKPMEDEWGNPIYEDEASSPQKSPQPAKYGKRRNKVSSYK
jgi:integrase